MTENVKKMSGDWLAAEALWNRFNNYEKLGNKSHMYLGDSLKKYRQNGNNVWYLNQAIRVEFSKQWTWNKTLNSENRYKFIVRQVYGALTLHGVING